MIKKNKCVFIYGLLFLISSPLHAQEEGTQRPNVSLQETTPRKNRVISGFDKSLNTYHWIGRGVYKHSSRFLSVELNEQFLSTLISTNRNLITDDQLFDLRLKYRLKDNLSIVSNVSSFLLSDNKSIGINRASSHAFYSGLSFQPMNIITVEPLVGIRFDNQLDQYDRGFSTVLTFFSDEIKYNGYITHLRGSFQYDKLDPRTLETHNDTIKINKVFFQRTRNTMQLIYYRNRRDFYLYTDSTIQKFYNVPYNIETRVDNTFSIADSLDYGISNRALITLHGNIFTRDIKRSLRYTTSADQRAPSSNTTINELKIEGSAKIHYTWDDHLTTMFSLSYLERDEKHQLQTDETLLATSLGRLTRNEEQKNNHSRRTSMVAMATLRPSESHQMTLSGYGSLLRYDTPRIENDDDRDELWYIFNLSTFHRINQYLILTLSADVSLIHLVYLMSARSADNTWNRVFRFAPKVAYEPLKNFSSTNSFEVLANYTVYDFDVASSLPRSFVFRQFAFIDSTSFALTSRLTLLWFSHIRFYERGELRWNIFSERPVNYFEDKTLLGSIHYAITDRLLFSVGIRYFSQLRYGYIGKNRDVESILRSIGPTTSVKININNRTILSIRGWYEHQSQTGQNDHGYTTMSMFLNLKI